MLTSFVPSHFLESLTGEQATWKRARDLANLVLQHVRAQLRLARVHQPTHLTSKSLHVRIHGHHLPAVTPLPPFVTSYLVFGDEQFTTLGALELLEDVFVCLFGVFSELIILEQLLAALIKALGHSRSLCLVSRHVQLVFFVCLYVLAT
jgi:hypothetical protein